MGERYEKLVAPAEKILRQTTEVCIGLGHEPVYNIACFPCLAWMLTVQLQDKAERCAQVLEKELAIQYTSTSDLLDQLAQMIREQEG